MIMSGGSLKSPTRILLVLEDSSKCGFGGGQRVTMQTLSVVSRHYYKTFIVDHWNPLRPSNRFSDSLSASSIEASFVRLPISLFRISSSESSSFAITLPEAIVGPFVLAFNALACFIFIVSIRIATNKHIVLYATTKKSLLLALFCRPLSTKIIYHSHNVASSSFGSVFLRHLALNKVDHEIAVSHAASNQIAVNTEIVPNSVRSCHSYGVISNAITKKISDKLYSDSKNITFACFSNHLKWKGHELMLRAFHHCIHCLSSANIEFKLLIYGTGPEAGNISRLIETLRLGQYVHMLGPTDSVDTILLEQVDATIIPSIGLEACPMTLIESLSCGVPVLTSSCGGQFEFLPSELKTFSFRPLCYESLSNSLHQLSLLSGPAYHDLAIACLKYSEIFSPRFFSSRVLKVFFDS